MSGHEGQLVQADLNGKLSDITFSDDRGFYAGEQLRAHFSVQANQTQTLPVSSQAGLILRTQIALRQGQIYIDPVFLRSHSNPSPL